MEMWKRKNQRFTIFEVEILRKKYISEWNCQISMIWYRPIGPYT